VGAREESAFMTGDGSGKPTGIQHTAGGVTVSQGATGNATSWTYDGLVTVLWTLPIQYRQNASLIVADNEYRNLLTLKDSQNRPIFSVDVTAAGPDTVLGFPVYISPPLPTPPATSTTPP